MQIASAQIGGGNVRRRFETGGKVIAAGTVLTGDQIRALRNHQALIEGGRIDVWPATINAADISFEETDPGERYVVHLGRGKYNVIEGRQLNVAPLTKDEADALASRA